MTNTYKFAEQELDILATTVPDSVLNPFRKEILALCEKFGKSGESGGSAPFTATAISKAVKTLLLQEPICDVTGHDDEWGELLEFGLPEDSDHSTYQNKRCSALFKEVTHYVGGDEVEYHYNDAIVWKGKEDWDTFTGRVYRDDRHFELIGSSQCVKFPFKPKTFYIDVVYVPITKEEAESRNLHYTEDRNGDCRYAVLKDPKQLEKVFKYYIEKKN